MKYKGTLQLIPALLLLTILCACSGSPGKKGASGTEKASSDLQLDGQVSTPAVEEELRQACLNGMESRVSELLDQGISVNAMDADGKTSLMLASFNGHSGIILKLLDAGAVVDRRDLMGRTALLYAATGPFPEAVSILLDKGADPNIVDSDEHFSPLMHAAAEGNLEVVRVLVQAGASQDLKDVDGDDAASFARQSGHTEVVSYLESRR